MNPLEFRAVYEVERQYASDIRNTTIVPERLAQSLRRAIQTLDTTAQVDGAFQPGVGGFIESRFSAGNSGPISAVSQREYEFNDMGELTTATITRLLIRRNKIIIPDRAPDVRDFTARGDGSLVRRSGPLSSRLDTRTETAAIYREQWNPAISNYENVPNLINPVLNREWENLMAPLEAKVELEEYNRDALTELNRSFRDRSFEEPAVNAARFTLAIARRIFG